MVRSTRRSTVVLIAAGIGLGLISPASAQTLTVTDLTRESDDTVLTIPEVTLTDASMSEADVRAFFASETPERAGEALLGLVARSIEIPEITVADSETSDDETKGELVLSGIALSDVSAGIAGRATIETATLELSNGTRFALGPFTVTNLNVDYLLSLQGIGTPTGDSTDLESVWSSLSLGPTQIASEDGTCALEGIEAGALLMRQPSRISLAGLFDYIDEARDAAKAAEDVEDETERRALRAEAAEKAAMLQSYYFDILQSFASGPISVTGIDCDITTDAGDPMAFAIGAISVGEAWPGTTPDIIVTGLSIERTGEDAGTLSMQTLHALPGNYSAAAEAFADIGDAVTAAWMEENQRRLVPSFGGFEIGGFAMDLPNDSQPGTRIVASIAGLSMLFDSYLNGIPTSVRSSATDITFQPTDEAAQVIAALGLDPLSVSYDLSARWDRARREIIIDKLMLGAVNGGTIMLAGRLGNAQPALFSTDEPTQLAAAQALTVKELRLHIADAGLLGPGLAMLAAEQGVSPEQFRPATAAMAQGVVLLGLGASPEAMRVSNAIGSFLRDGGEITITAVSKSPAGVSLAAMQEAGEPGAVLKQFDITVPEAAAPPPAQPEAGAPALPEPEPAAEAPASETRSVPAAPADDAAPAEPASGTISNEGMKEKPKK